jgi:hydroxyacylglutathione hydrolase
MTIRTLIVGTMEANCYILECEETKAAIVIDPGDDVDEIIKVIEKNKLQTKFIVNTHAHVDHITGNSELKKKTSALLCAHLEAADILVNPQRNLSFFIGEEIRSPKPDKLLSDGDALEAGTLNLKVIYTPGHSPDSICLLAGNCIFTGDLLFAGGIGRYDFPGSSYKVLMDSLKKIMTLDDRFVVYPGHGPETTIGDERKTNPFLVDLL